jgi:eukaryotic-like serine/threonine-protein kinase
MSDPMNKRLGDYEILKVLGSGGMGRVYQVRNAITDRVEAMKVLLPDLEGHEDVAARFQREIKVLAALNHPNIAALHTALIIENQLVMIMEYVEGESVSSRLGHGPIPVPDALNYLDQVLNALSYAHHQHVIHRDIKPANMMLTPQGTVKLMDFGIARTEKEPNKLTATGSTLGSMNYMSPEQIKGEPTDERSDLYSLGISLYEMITGKKPFQGDSNFSIMAAHINQAPTPPVDLDPELPRVVNDIILTSIAKAPGQRFQSADAFRHAVKQAVQSMQAEKTLVQGSADNSLSSTPTPAAYSATAPAITGKNKAPERRPASAFQPMTIPPPAPTSHRGLYMGLGALVVVVVLAAAGLYMPKWKKTSASETVGQHQQEAATKTVQPVQPVVADKQAAEPKPGEEIKPADVRPKKLIAKKANLAETTGAAGNSQAASSNAAELDAVERDLDQLTSRAAAVNSSLDTLQRQQAAAGYGLRGDIAAKQASMKLNLAKAQDAVEHNDAARAKRYAEMTSTELEALEKFLGR